MSLTAWLLARQYRAHVPAPSPPPRLLARPGRVRAGADGADADDVDGVPEHEAHHFDQGESQEAAPSQADRNLR